MFSIDFFKGCGYVVVYGCCNLGMAAVWVMILSCV